MVTQSDTVNLSKKQVGFLLKNFLRTQTTDASAVPTGEPTRDPTVVYSRIVYSDEIYTTSINADPESYGIPPTSENTMQQDENDNNIKDGYQVKRNEENEPVWIKWINGEAEDSSATIDIEDDNYGTGVVISKVVKEMIDAVVEEDAEGVIIDLSLVLAKVYFLKLNFAGNATTSPSFYHPCLRMDSHRHTREVP